MEMVGPHLEDNVLGEVREKEIPYYRFRHAIEPRVTSLTQVK